MKLNDIALRLTAHLKRIEADPALNKARPVSGFRMLYDATVRNAGSCLMVTYATNVEHRLTKTEALAYLAWLDAGNVGTHYTQQKEQKT